MNTKILFSVAMVLILCDRSFPQTRSPWEMNQGEAVVSFGFTSPQHGDPGEYAFATIPAPDDAAWGPAPDPDIIGFSVPSTLCGVVGCRQGGDFTYFRTFVDIPANVLVTKFTIATSGVDDGVRVTIFNSMFPAGEVVPGSYIFLGGSGTADLKDLVVSGEVNTVISTHVDDCCSESYLRSAVVVLNGTTVPVQPEFLIGVDGDDDFLIRLDINAVSPTVEILGTVVDGSQSIVDLEAMTWDPESGRILVISNEDDGPLFSIDPADINSTDDIPATFIGNTESDDIEGMAVHPVTGELFGVDNDSHKLVSISKSTGAVTEIGDLGFKDVEGLAFTLDANPVLYGADTRSGKLIRIDIATGAGAEVDPDNPVGFRNVECLVFLPDSLFIGFSNGATDEFVVIDPATGIGSILPTTGAQDLDIEGLTFLLPNKLLMGGGNASFTTSVARSSRVPATVVLEQNYPNPFNPETTIRFQLAEPSHVRLSIFNTLGRKIRELVNNRYTPGNYGVHWDGKDENGNLVANGIYYYQLRAGGFIQVKEMSFLK